MLALDYKGNIYPCIRFMPSSLGNNKKPLLLGDAENGILGLEEYVNNHN